MSLADLFKHKEQKNIVPDPDRQEHTEDTKVSAASREEDREESSKVLPGDGGAKKPEGNTPAGAAKGGPASENPSDAEPDPEDPGKSMFPLRLRKVRANDIKPLFSYYQRCAADPGARLPSAGIGLVFENLLDEVLVPEWENYIESEELDDFVASICRSAAELSQRDETSSPLVCSMIPQDALAAFVCILPPTAFGAALEEKHVTEVLLRNGIQPSCFLAGNIAAAVRDRQYFRIFAAAKGNPPVKGQDGKVLDRYPREWNPPAGDGEDGSQEIKSLKFVTPIRKGDVICEFTQPTLGTAGANIFGKIILPKHGAPAKVPNGRNTELSEDRSLLLASVDGHIIYENHEFHVNHTLSIPGSLDGSVGSYNFMGNIEVNGNVALGVKLSADGDIKIYGTAEGANFTAKGHITLKNGMNGNFSGYIRAGQYVKSRFLENTNIRAREDILTESIVNCTVAGGREVEVTRGSGTIMGGTIYALRSVRAKMIGKPSGIATEIHLGTLPQTDNTELEQLEAQKKEMQATLDNLTRNLDYFKRTGASEKSKDMYDQLCVQADLYQEKIGGLDAQITKLANPEVSLDECFVEANVIYPNTKIYIGSSYLLVTETEHSCRFFYSGQERQIIRGSMF